MPIVRTRYIGDEDVIVQRKVWFLPRSWTIAWYDYASLRNNLHSIESRLLSAVASIDKLLKEWSTEKEHLDAEIRSVKTGKFNEFGVSKPFYIKEKGLRAWIGGQTYVPRPEESWKAFINQAKLIQYGVNKPSGKRTTIPNAAISNTTGKGTSRYTLPEHAEKGIHVQGIDQVIPYKEESRGGNNVSKNRMKQLRSEYPKESGESDQDWNIRLQKIAKSNSEE